MSYSLHLLNSWLEISETFIWNSLRELSRYKPLILASELKNREKFPLPQGEILNCHPSADKLKNIWGRITGTFLTQNYSSCLNKVSQKPVEVIHAHYGYRALVAADLIAALNKPLVTQFYGFDLSNKAFLARGKQGYQHLFKQLE